MRRNEITSELIELSKRAKELGFPQDVEEGDWAYESKDEHRVFLIGSEIKKIIDSQEYERLILGGYTLILSFSRCLEWLEQQGDLDRFSVVRYRIYGISHVGWEAIATIKYLDGQRFEGIAKTHHEAMAKAVVKILEESKEGGEE